MNQAPTLTVTLVGPAVWRTERRAWEESLNPGQRRFANAVLALAQSRHVGITAALVTDLVPSLLDPGQTPRGVWHKVFARLARERTQLGAQRSVKGTGIVPGSNPTYCVLRLALPLVTLGCGLIGQSLLFCEEEVPAGPSLKSLQDYHLQLSAAIEAIAEEDAHALFWGERALALAASSRQPAAAQSGSLPGVDPASLGVLLRLKADLPGGHGQPRRPRRLPSPRTPLWASHSKEGGVDGIHHTRRPEDLDGILLSEFINPDHILAERLLNTGFFATRRQPRREPLRDVMITAILPADPALNPALSLAKACWFECMLHLSLLLRRQGMGRGAFRWLQGNALGQMVIQDFNLEDLPSLAAIQDGPPTQAFRAEFMSALRWLPRYLDQRCGGIDLTAPLPASFAANRMTDLQNWALGAWKAQQAVPIGNTGTTKGESFAYQHLMLFLPAPESDHTPLQWAPLYAGFELAHRPGGQLGITWVPGSLSSGTDWAFAGRGTPRKAILQEDKEDGDSARMVAPLIRTWLDQFTKEIWRG